MSWNVHNVGLYARASDATIPAPFKDISLDKAELVAIFLEALLFGVEALTFVATVYLLHGAKHSKTLLLKFTTVISIFLLNTIHMGSSLRRILNAFVGSIDDPIPDAAAYLADLAGFLYRFKNIIIVIQFIMLDVLVVYRCYMIWDKKIIVTLIPSFGIVAFLITGIAAIHAFATDTSDTVFTGMTRTWVSAMLCITLFTKLVCFATVLSGTLLPRPSSPWHSIYLRVNRHATFYKSLLIGIESGGLAVLGAVVLIPIYLAGRNAQGIMLAAMSPLTGQAFLLIVAASLLGLTPSTSGPSRRRKGNPFPHPRLSLPPIAISPISSPTSRFSTGSLFKSPKAVTSTLQSQSQSSDSGSPSTPTDSCLRVPDFMKTREPEQAYTESRYDRGYVRGAVLPRSTEFVLQEEDLDLEANTERELRAAPGMELSRTQSDGTGSSSRETLGLRDAEPVSVMPDSQGGAFHLARSADGAVEVLQREHVRVSSS